MSDQRVLTVLDTLEKKCQGMADLVLQMQKEIQSLRQELMQTVETGRFMAPGRAAAAKQPMPASPGTKSDIGLPPGMRK